jgi:DNA adenine methylase
MTPSPSLERLDDMDPALRQAIRGQDHVIPAVVERILIGETGLATPGRPKGSFLFIGPTGVGKTELARVLARHLFAQEEPFRFDMSEFSADDAIKNFIGDEKGGLGRLGNAAPTGSGTFTMSSMRIWARHPVPSPPTPLLPFPPSAKAGPDDNPHPKKSMTRVKPILRWSGGKSRLLKYLLPLIPPHVCYCEPFAGGLALLLAKERSDLEVVNDLKSDLVQLYRNVQYHLPALLQEIEWILNSRKNLEDFIAQPGLTEIQRAARWLIRNKISFGGKMTSFGVCRTGGGGGSASRSGIGEALKAFNARMDRVMVENLSYERCLKLYDGPQTFFFIDPPYLDSNPGTYQGWNQDQITLLRERIGGLKGRWLLTLDDSGFNRRLFRGFQIKRVKTFNGGVNHAKLPRAQFGELIIRPGRS